jgi:hypothetical protein
MKVRLRLAVAVSGVFAAWSLLLAQQAPHAAGLPTVLVPATDLVYEGAFRLPGPSGPTGDSGDAISFSAAGGALAYYEPNSSLFTAGTRSVQPTAVAEISGPPTSAAVRAEATAS